MLIYVGKNFTAALSGAVVRDVTCEKCSGRYQYRLIRRGEAVATAPYYIAQGAAERRAQRGAQRSLEKQLRRDVDPVACPDCGWFQAEMLRELRKRSHRWLKWTAGIFGAAMAISFVVWLGNVTKGFDRSLDDDDFTISIIFEIAVALSFVGPLVLRMVLLRMSDPNRAYPEKPAPIPGAPKAFKPGQESVVAAGENIEASATGQLAYERRPPEVEPGGWITVQLLELTTPTRCCSCLSETHRYGAWAKNELVAIRLPHCPLCAAQDRRLKLTWMLGLAIVCAAIGVGLTFLPDMRKDFAAPGAKAVWGVIGAVVGCIAGMVISGNFTGPVVFGRFDKRLNTLRMRFRNPNYAAVMAAELARPLKPAGPPVPLHQAASLFPAEAGHKIG